MTGCEGCFQSAKGLQMAYEKIKAEAIKYSKENGKTVAIYKEGFEWFYCTAELAIANNCPRPEFISENF